MKQIYASEDLVIKTFWPCCKYLHLQNTIQLLKTSTSSKGNEYCKDFNMTEVGHFV